jgi:hypothetical protein
MGPWNYSRTKSQQILALMRLLGKKLETVELLIYRDTLISRRRNASQLSRNFFQVAATLNRLKVQIDTIRNTAQRRVTFTYKWENLRKALLNVVAALRQLTEQWRWRKEWPLVSHRQTYLRSPTMQLLTYSITKAIRLSKIVTYKMPTLEHYVKLSVDPDGTLGSPISLENSWITHRTLGP